MNKQGIIQQLESMKIIDGGEFLHIESYNQAIDDVIRKVEDEL